MTDPRLLRSPDSSLVSEVATELQRVVERWRQLPLDHALSYAGRVRTLVQSLADAVAMGDGMANGMSSAALPVVPDLGPATLMDQLTVMVHDASVAAVTSTRTSLRTSTLAEELASLRRELC